MRKVFVITGGTDGIGAAAARALAERGDTAITVGRSADKGKLAETEEESLPGAIEFVQADLSLITENRRAVAKIAAANPSIHGLVLCARYYRATRHETSEGIEDTFALNYLSRLLFGEGLLPNLARADNPAIVNISGPGLDNPVDLENLQLERDYSGFAAMKLGGRLNDLLGVNFAAAHGNRVRYVLLHPGETATSFAGEFEPQVLAYVEHMKANAKPAADVARLVVSLLDSTERIPLRAFGMEGEIHLDKRLFSPDLAERLAAYTRKILGRENAVY